MPGVNESVPAVIVFVVNRNIPRPSTANLVSMYLLRHIEISMENIVSEKFQWEIHQFRMLSLIKRKNAFNMGGCFGCNTLISIELE